MRNLLMRICKHWQTSLLGVIAIAFGVWSSCVVWVPYQTIKFNLVYVLPGHLALIVAGIGLLLAADHSRVERTIQNKP
jgi:hypothetical protein